jgi:hypothetical protein
MPLLSDFACPLIAKAGSKMAMPLITSNLLEGVMIRSYQKVPIRRLQGIFIPSGAF